MRIPAEVEVLDDRVRDLRTDSTLAVHYRRGRWLEGPAYSVQGRHLLFSDIPSDVVLRLDLASGRVSEFDRPARFANGRTFDAQGRVVTCLHGARAVVRREHDGSESVLADSFDGGLLNSPNDVVVDSAGDVWFTDPTYGIVSDYEGHAAPSEQPVCGVYRRHEADGRLELVTGAFDQPNGLAFSRDESVLYVVDSGRDTLSVLDPTGEGIRELVAGRGFDGIRIDPAGRIWAATYAGVSCFDAEGVELLRIALPERASNLCFGGLRGNELFVTATTSLYSLRLSVTGV